MNTELPDTTRISSRVWIVGAVVLAAILVFGIPASRQRLAGLFHSLREPSFQSVNVNVSGFVGPDANPAVHQMLTQMIADRVTTLKNEPPQPASTLAQAGSLAGFTVQGLRQRHDAPEVTVLGQRAFEVIVDRSRLQAILAEAGRSDLVLPQSIDGAQVSVQIPRSVRARYGRCPRRPSATANIATPAPTSTEYGDCVILTEGPSPQVTAPPGFDLAPLAQIGLEAAGLSSAQAQQFLQTVNWRSALAVSIPRLRSYAPVEVNGVPGTLLNLSGRNGATYRLIWVKNGMVYTLTGYGDPLQAVRLAATIG
jgi:hypothetical protein